jgi:DNA-binding response OmpR family regulator
MKMGLEKHGFSVDAFNDPKMALSHFKPNYYDAIVLDVRMPA